MKNIVCVILAAGYGKRLGTKGQKVIQKVFGKPMLSYLLSTIKKISPQKIVIVVGYKKEEVFKELEGEKVEYVEQPQLLGTADAVAKTKDILNNYNGDILVTYGDIPFITKETLEKLIEIHKKEKSICTILTTIVENPKGYGRIKRDKKGNIIKIVEEVNASEEEKKIKEINAGVYVFKKQPLFDTISKISLDPIKKEYYLTDVIKVFVKNGEKISTYLTPEPEETLGINTPEDLKKAEEFLKRRIQ